MARGLLNLVAYGNRNVILNGNPSKTFFKTTYSKYKNFGLQKFRIDFDGQKRLRETTNTTFLFTVPRYADLLMDTYFVITMPHIWSPLYLPNADLSGAGSAAVIDPSNCPCGSPPSHPILHPDAYLEWAKCAAHCTIISLENGNLCQPYEFKWIENLGTQLIKSIKYTIGGQIIQEFSGDYLHAMVQRDFSAAKKDLFDNMTGNTTQMNDPANYSNNKGNYPNYVATTLNSEPSIRGRKLYIPLNIWSTLSSKLAIPLISLKHNLLRVEITCRPIRELFVIRDINHYLTQRWDICGNETAGIIPNADVSYSTPPYISTMNIVDPKYQMYLFLTQDEEAFASLKISGVKFDPTKQSNWYADPHLVSTYGFLGKEETRQFVGNPQKYLIKQVHEKVINRSAADDEKIRFYTTGLVSSWMWYFRRNDAFLRNEWSNYTNWPYNYLPYPCINIFDISNNPMASYQTPCPPKQSTSPNAFPYSPHFKHNKPGTNAPYITGPYHPENDKHIMKSWNLYLDGAIREGSLSANVLNSIEKYVRTGGNAEQGLYCYNFSLNTDPFQYQPSGAINLTHFHNIDWQYTTIGPPRDISSQLLIVCDSSNEIVGYNKVNWKLHDYNYDLRIMEERYNILTFDKGHATLMNNYG